MDAIAVLAERSVLALSEPPPVVEDRQILLQLRAAVRGYEGDAHRRMAESSSQGRWGA